MYEQVNTDIQSEIQPLLDDLFLLSPELETWLSAYGNMPVEEYLQTFRSTHGPWFLDIPNTSYEATCMLERLYQVATVISQEAQAQLGNIYDNTIGERVFSQLLEECCIDTGPHFSPVWNADFLSNYLANALGRSPNHVALILADTSIRLNSQGNPGRIGYYSSSGKTSIPFTPKNHDTAVIGAPAFNKDDMLKVTAMIGSLYAKGDINLQTRDNLNIALRRLIKDPMYNDILSCTNLADQITKMNALLFRYLFDPEQQKQIPALATLNCERIASALIQKAIRDDPLLSSIILKPEVRADFIHMANDIGVIGSTDLFFACINGERRTLRIAQHDGQYFLIESSPSKQLYILPLEEKSILFALQQGHIYPGPALAYMTLMHHGLSCAGGKKQITYLSEFKERIVSFLHAYGYTQESEIMRHCNTLRLSGGLCFGFTMHNGHLIPASGVDMMGRSNAANRWSGMTETQIQQLFSLRVDQLFFASLPWIYKTMTGKTSAISTMQIAHALGIMDALPIFPR